jgi:hypothetical protein
VAQGTRITPPSGHLLDFLRYLIDTGIPVLLHEVEDPAHDPLARQTTAEDQATQGHEAGHRIHPLLQPEVLDGNCASRVCSVSAAPVPATLPPVPLRSQHFAHLPPGSGSPPLPRASPVRPDHSTRLATILSYAKLISSHRFSPSLDRRFDKVVRWKPIGGCGLARLAEVKGLLRSRALSGTCRESCSKSRGRRITCSGGRLRDLGG